VQTNDSGNYLLIITNYAGSVTSSIAVLTVTNELPQITVQPTNQAVPAGSFVTFNVVATGTPPLSYQWQAGVTNLVGTNLVNGVRISGATDSVLTISPVQTNDSGNYLLIITNYVGSATSSVAVLTVTNEPPEITVQPTNQTVGVGSTVTFFINGSASPPFSLQWQKNGIALTDGTNSSGSIVIDSTGDPMTISNVQTNDDGGYSIIVTNLFGTATSSVAVLTVLPAPLFGNIMVAGGTNAILSGVGGSNSATYYVLTSSNLLVPLDLWTRIATNQFDSVGGFIFTNAAQTNAPQMFYILEQP